MPGNPLTEQEKNYLVNYAAELQSAGRLDDAVLGFILSLPAGQQRDGLVAICVAYREYKQAQREAYLGAAAVYDPEIATATALIGA